MSEPTLVTAYTIRFSTSRDERGKLVHTATCSCGRVIRRPHPGQLRIEASIHLQSHEED